MNEQVNQYLDLEGFKEFARRTLIKRSGSKNYWENNSEYIPLKNELIIYVDAFQSKGPTGLNVFTPALKLGDGVTKVSELPFMLKTADKLNHSLTIGEHVFDGTADVIIPIYKGETK